MSIRGILNKLQCTYIQWNPAPPLKSEIVLYILTWPDVSNKSKWKNKIAE